MSYPLVVLRMPRCASIRNNPVVYLLARGSAQHVRNRITSISRLSSISLNAAVSEVGFSVRIPSFASTWIVTFAPTVPR